MLSEESKEILKIAVGTYLRESNGDVEFLARMGPDKLLRDSILKEMDLAFAPEGQHDSFSANVRENREEAEKFLAGLLGMM